MVLRSDTSPFTPEFDTLVHKQLEKWKVPGLTIAIVHGPRAYSKAYGIAEFPAKKMTTGSLFSTCSTTKAFTAAAVSLAIDDSNISWDTPISTLIPDDFVLANEHATTSTTLEDALSHRSGLPGHESAMAMANPRETLRDEVRKLRSLPLATSPRSTWAYCNHMYMAVSHALVTLTHQPLGTTLKHRIWGPLDMHHTYFSIAEAKQSPDARSLVRGYTFVPDLNTYIPEPHMNYAPTTGAGSIVSTVLDYAKWIRSWIHRSGPLSSTAYASLLTPRSIITNDEGLVVPDAPYHLYALGWFVDQIRGEQLYWHSGSWPGFGIMVGFVPGREWGFAMMGNAVDAREVEKEIYLYLIGRLQSQSQSGGNGCDGLREDRTAGKKEPGKRTGTGTGAESVEEAKKRVFPSLPDPLLPHVLPLHLYAGTYRNEGYGSFGLVAEKGRLGADLTDRAIRQKLEFEHASGEFFVCLAYVPAQGKGLGQKFQAEFYVDVNGTARRVGVDFEPALGGEKIWFERVG